MHIIGYTPRLEKVLRMHSTTSTIENGFVYLPEKAPWLDEYVHELSTFPNGRYDDQVDSTSQALDWIKERAREPWILVWARQEAERIKTQPRQRGKSWAYVNGEFTVL